MKDFTRAAWCVFRKELIDGLRDRRTLLRLLIPAVLMGPLMLLALTGLIQSLEASAEKREVYVVGIENAPTLRNYLERQSYRVKSAPTDYEAQLRSSQLLDPVLIVPKNFEPDLLNGEQPMLTVVSDSANQRASAGVRSLTGLLRGFSQERAMLQLALRGVPAELLSPVDVNERDLANPQARAAQLIGFLPMFLMMAVLQGALTAALDSTAGERERGSLEPLLMNPVPTGALVLGKWGAVALLGMAVAVLANFGFLPSQYLIRSDSLRAMFQFGWGEIGAFLLLQLPLAAGVSALLMTRAIRSKTLKEAQASAALVIVLVSLTPMVGLFNPGGEASWYLWVPGLGQSTLMMRVLKGDLPTLVQMAQPALVGVALTVLCLWDVARSMRSAVAR